MNKKPRSYSQRYGEQNKRNGSRRAFTPSAPRGYKSDLNKMFDTGKVPDRFKELVHDTSAGGKGADRQKLIRAARQAETAAEFKELMTKLVADYELPDDQALLIRALDHDQDDVLIAALDALIELDGRRPLTKRTILKMRLDTLEQVATNPAIFDMIEMLRARL